MHNPPVREEMNNRRPTPRRYCLLVLRGAPFIICSNCFRLLQLPSGFAIPNRGICGLQCGSCSEVLSYSYRDPYRMKRQSSYGDECSADDEDSTDDFGTRRTFVQEISRDRNALGRAAASPSPPPPPPPRCQAADDDLRVTVAAAALQLIQFQAQWKKGRFLGSGSFGQVYLGVNSENDQFCAIKEVQFTLDDPHSKERLKQVNREIDMLRHLSHPNIVQYYESDLHLTDHVLSIYLEYVPNGSIHTILQKYGPFKEPMIRNYTGQILSGLAYLHGKKTVHRDIKGANILVGPNGEVKLSDFGMAKHISSFAEIHSLKGSAKWMAPEVIMSNYSGEGYNLAVDIWSLGCTVIEMATARPPWHQYEPVAAIFKIAHSKDIPDIPDILSEEGKSFLQLCLERDPASRPSALQLMDHPFVQDRPAM